jgi:hypothetical protein
MAIKANLDVGGGGVVPSVYIRIVRPQVIDRMVVDEETGVESKEFGVQYWTEVHKDEAARQKGEQQIPVSTIGTATAWGYDPDGAAANPYAFAYADLAAHEAVTEAVAT